MVDDVGAKWQLEVSLSHFHFHDSCFDGIKKELALKPVA